MEGKDGVKEYYKDSVLNPEEIEDKAIAVTSCNRAAVNIPPHVKEALSLVHEDIIKRSLGCSCLYPEALEGCKVLDLGSGAGKDCYVLSRLVGQEGTVVGMDMIDDMLEVANSKIEFHRDRFGYTSANVSFVKGYMEKMKEIGLEENHFDVLISNCVISLCKDKKKVLQEAARVLKPNGEMFFSDMYRDRDLPLGLADDNRLWCEGITGAMTYLELHEMASQVGFHTPRLVKADRLPIKDKCAHDKIGDVQYAAVTYRLHKKSDQPASPAASYVYKGGIVGSEDSFKFDHNLVFEKNVGVSLDEETATILCQSRFGKYFEKSSEFDKSNDKSFLVVNPFSLL